MSYIAIHYVKIGGKLYKPGDVINVEIREDALSRLLLAAIAPAPSTSAPVTGDNAGDGVPTGNEQDSAELTRQNHADQLENLGYDASGDPVDPEETEEAVEEEVPEIDAMDGISSAAAVEEAAEQPVKKNSRRKKA